MSDHYVLQLHLNVHHFWGSSVHILANTTNYQQISNISDLQLEVIG